MKKILVIFIKALILVVAMIMLVTSYDDSAPHRLFFFVQSMLFAVLYVGFDEFAKKL